jgi:hypothetical protein
MRCLELTDEALGTRRISTRESRVPDSQRIESGLFWRSALARQAAQRPSMADSEDVVPPSSVDERARCCYIHQEKLPQKRSIGRR